MRKILSLYELFDKESEYFEASNYNEKIFITSYNKIDFLKKLNMYFHKFKIIKFQNDRKANIQRYKQINDKISDIPMIIVLPPFDRIKLLKGESPLIRFWLFEKHYYYSQFFSRIIKNKKNLYDYIQKYYILNNIQRHWLKEYLGLKEKKDSKITIKFKKI